MKIDLATLDATGFKLELPRGSAGPGDVVEIAAARGLGGRYAHDAKKVLLEGLRAVHLTLATVTWHLGAGVVATRATELDEPHVDLHIPRGAGSVRGRLGAQRLYTQDLHVDQAGVKLVAEVDARALSVELGARGHTVTVAASELAAPRFALFNESFALKAAGLVTRGLALEHGDHATTLQLAELQASDVGARIPVAADEPSIDFSVASILATGLHVVRSGGALEIVAAHVVLRELSFDRSGVELEVAEVELTGLKFAGGVLEVDRFSVPGATVAVELATSQEAPPSPPKPAKRSSKKAPLDLGFLDHLQGRIDVDVTVDAKVPYLKRRKATHHFRVSVETGTLDYKELEGDLSALEDALIDFAVRKGNLVLEVSPPLLSMLRKTLVEWPLDDAGRSLAERRRVRLATLAHPKLPAVKPAPAESRADPSFSLDRLDFAPIDVELSLGGPSRLDLGARGVIHLGAPGRAALGKLFVRGELHHRAATTARRSTELLISATQLFATLEHVALPRGHLDVAELGIERIDEARVVARGLAPTHARADFVQISGRALRLAL
jgi:hypothetical protein